MIPELANKIREVLLKGGNNIIAQAVPSTRVVDKFRCNQDLCAPNYIAPQVAGARGLGHETVPLGPEKKFHSYEDSHQAEENHETIS